MPFYSFTSNGFKWKKGNYQLSFYNPRQPQSNERDVHQ